MGIARRPSEQIKPLPRLPELDEWKSQWVAVKNDRVIAAATTSSELASRLLEMGDDGRGAVVQFVHPDAEAYIVGAG